MIVADNTKVVGVISYADLIEDDVARNGDSPASQVIRKSVVHLARDDMPLRDAAQTMVRRKLGCLPVVDDEGNLSGILTRADIISVALKSLHKEEEEQR